MPKPVYATADELAEAVKKLEGQVWLQVMSEGLIRSASGWITNSIAVVIGVYVCIYIYEYQTKLGMTKVGLIGSWGCHVTPMRIQCIGQICLPNTSILVVKSL